MNLAELCATFKTGDWWGELQSMGLARQSVSLSSEEISSIASDVQHNLSTGKAGSALNWLSVGLYFDELRFLLFVRRAGILRSSRYDFQSKAIRVAMNALIDRSQAMGLNANTKAYLSSVAALSSVCSAVQVLVHQVIHIFRQNTPGLFKSLVAIVDAMFLSPKPDKPE